MRHDDKATAIFKDFFESGKGATDTGIIGYVTVLIEGQHAVGLKTESGLEVMLHLGIDTVELEGKPFTLKVKEGDQVTSETQLIEMDLKQIETAKKDPTVMTLITNSSDRVEQVEDIVTSGQLVEAHNEVYSVTTK